MTRSREFHMFYRHLCRTQSRVVYDGREYRGRIFELLSVQISDVDQNGGSVTDMLFEKSIVKGGEVSRAVPVNQDSRLAIDDLIAWHRQHYQKIDPSRPLFPLRHKSGTVPMHRQPPTTSSKTRLLQRG